MSICLFIGLNKSAIRLKSIIYQMVSSVTVGLAFYVLKFIKNPDCSTECQGYDFDYL